MSDNQTTELESLSKLKKAGKLRYWRGTIEIPESELHAICDEIQAEHDRAVAATLGEQRSTVEIAELLDEFESDCFMLRVEASETRAKDDVVRESYERILDEFAGRIAVAGGAGECELVETESYSNANEVIHVLECSACGKTCEHVNGSYPRCPHCGRKAVTR